MNANLIRFTSADFDPFRKMSVGFDRVFDQLTNGSHWESPSYPPYNIVRVDRYNHIIELAVAGFKKSELDIELEKNILTIKGESDSSEKQKLVHQGIASRSFHRRFSVSDNVEVRGASLEDGILSIHMEEVVPEEEKPKKIEIGEVIEVKQKEFLTG